MVSVFSVVAITIVASILAFAVYYIIYNTRINKKIRNNESTAHNPMMPIDTFGRILICIVCLTLIASQLTVMYGFQKELDTMESIRDDMNTQIKGLSDYMSILGGALDNFQEHYRDNESPLSDYGYEVLDVNSEDLSVKLKVYCTLKSYSEDTQLTLTNNDRTFELNNDGNGYFSAVINLLLNDTVKTDTNLKIEGNGVVNSSVVINWLPYSPCEACIPQFHIRSTGYIRPNDYEEDIDIDVQVELPDNADSFTDIKGYIVKNGKIVTSAQVNAVDIWYEGTVRWNSSDDIYVVLSGVDRYGFTHKNRYIINGESHYGNHDVILDKNGNVIYGEDFL